MSGISRVSCVTILTWAIKEVWTRSAGMWISRCKAMLPSRVGVVVAKRER